MLCVKGHPVLHVKISFEYVCNCVFDQKTEGEDSRFFGAKLDNSV